MEKLSEKLKAQIQAYIEKNQPEVYWDYRSNLSSDQIEKIFTDPENGMCEVESELIDINLDYEFELIQSTLDEIVNYFENEICDETNQEKIEWEDDFRDWARDFVYVDYNLDDLIRNTGDQVFFYDTGHEFQGWGRSAAEYRLDRIIIKNALNIKNSKYDADIDTMLAQASYGGQLVIYFNSEINKLLDGMKDSNTIRFKNASIAIIDTLNGSGDSCEIIGHEFTLPFDVKNLFYEKSIKYNYTYEVCGMSSDWCENTQLSFEKHETTAEVKTSGLSAIQEQDKVFKATFNSGKCTFGDRDFKRHRDVFYINEFPCGNKCPHCGQFWID